ncbi:MAG: regulator of protease activity HflC (stomatin/prohibitin superfamily) [Cycloclasticus pugetii]|jgi:regulator of protease activity HflC (stomatin/prohibitin superfamily)|uniref:Membrane protease subunit HflK n=2 Tax=Cycloclasticus TaxID=34067 RepID=S5TCF4_9GAMM|nr:MULTISPECIES: SPFH domain-containing protein [Cycloclasticus]AFT66184.1 Membrane protease subunit [Cycloclasticus sp. P1]AGS38492.1 Membrane protease subunit HflK [Cycloclasticus zancles 78-ME]ATI02040.1 SPFH/Band 7/PHB domain protein [Cycloclasticus sp. PY97N]EPD13216.1 membrane protease subunit [Cycloclasticus pugetii]MBV1899394.1 SPFH/Band 7/PHB domain protein [Cycloclasticus sp.]
MEGLIVAAVFFGLVFLTVAMGVKLVPQGSKFVVQRLGKFHKTLGPGLNLVVPYIDQVAYRVTTKDIVLDIPSQEVITQDNVVIIANAVAYINIVAPERAVYGVEDYELAIRTLVQTSLRSIVGEMKLDDALTSRELIKARLKEAISDDISDWGITLKTVEIQDITPSGTMQNAMEEQAAAERQRRATVTRAEGEKAAAVLEAEGRLDASRRDAEAQVVLAEASKLAITKVAEAIQDKELPVMYILGEKYVDAIQDMSNSDNAKTILLPADLPAAIKGMLGGR